MIEHYFVAAWLPPESSKIQRQFYTTKLEGGLYTAGIRYAEGPVAPGANEPATELALKQLDADGKVHYVLTNEQASTGSAGAKSQTIDCSHLVLQTAKDANNKTYASAMNADGGVHAFDDTQDMQCGQLAMPHRVIVLMSRFDAHRQNTAPARQRNSSEYGR